MYETLDDVPNCTEAAKIEGWRLKCALDLGYSVRDAERIASERGYDLHRLERLIRSGATPDQALRIEQP